MIATSFKQEAKGSTNKKRVFLLRCKASIELIKVKRVNTVFLKTVWHAVAQKAYRMRFTVGHKLTLGTPSSLDRKVQPRGSYGEYAKNLICFNTKRMSLEAHLHMSVTKELHLK